MRYPEELAIRKTDKLEMDNHKVKETSENRPHGMGAVLIRPRDTDSACSEIVSVEEGW